jgi:hypothetical protein
VALGGVVAAGDRLGEGDELGDADGAALGTGDGLGTGTLESGSTDRIHVVVLARLTVEAAASRGPVTVPERPAV